MYGKALRLERLTHSKSKRMCMVPLDHGITVGPIDGIRDYLNTIGQVVDGGADAVILHKGLFKAAIQQEQLLKGKYIMHLSASTVLGLDPHAKVLVGSVEEAIELGADGVSIHVNLGCKTESEMIRDLGKVSSECQKWGMPLLAMMYVQSQNGMQNDNKLIHGVRIAEELGADIVKVNYPGSRGTLEKLMQSVRIPVLIAGGVKVDRPEELLKMVDNVLGLGVKGVAIGRNIFQFPQPRFMTRLISKMVHNEISLQEALLDLEHILEVAL